MIQHTLFCSDLFRETVMFIGLIAALCLLSVSFHCRLGAPGLSASDRLGT
jgi:hypothetical protein